MNRYQSLYEAKIVPKFEVGDMVMARHGKKGDIILGKISRKYSPSLFLIAKDLTEPWGEANTVYRRDIIPITQHTLLKAIKQKPYLKKSEDVRKLRASLETLPKEFGPSPLELGLYD